MRIFVTIKLSLPYLVRFKGRIIFCCHFDPERYKLFVTVVANKCSNPTNYWCKTLTSSEGPLYFFVPILKWYGMQ